MGYVAPQIRGQIRRLVKEKRLRYANVMC